MGFSAEAERVVKCLNKAVAANSDVPERIIATRFWQRIGVDLLRGACKSFHRRLAGKDAGEVSCMDPFRGLSGLVVAAGA